MENISYRWCNINHHQQETEENIIFSSENIFLNPITASTGGQFGSYRQSAPARLDPIDWCQSLAFNGLHDGKTTLPVTATTTNTATNCNASCTSTDHEDDYISVIFSDHKNSYTKIVKNLTGVSSNDSCAKETDDGIVSQCSSKRRRSDPVRSTSSTINFQQEADSDVTDAEVIAQMKEMIYTAAAFRPVSFADDEVEKPKRRNVRISSDPQTVAARRRRERVSERIRVLQKLVPGGDKMDTASMLDEAANYLKFLRSQVKALEQFGLNLDYVSSGTTTNAQGTTQNAQNINHSLTLGLPFPMHSHFLPPN